MLNKHTNNIVLIGFSGSGKSSVGKLLAPRLGFAFVDLDTQIERAHKDHSGNVLTCRQIYSEFGQAYFDELALEAFGFLKGQTGIVLSTGGGAITVIDIRNTIKDFGTVFYLDTKPQIIFNRLKKRGFPQFLKSDPTLENVEKHWEARNSLYGESSHFCIDNSAQKPDETVDEIIKILQHNEKGDR